MNLTTETYESMLCERVHAHRRREAEKADAAAKLQAEIAEQNLSYIAELDVGAPDAVG